MPKSSRHRSSKHSSRDARDCYSDSDNDSSPKERRGGSEDGGGGVRVSKDSGFSDKRKDSNGEYAEDDHGGSSKRRKDRGSDRVSDRWNGGSEEGLSKVKPSSESKSRKRDEESEDVKRSGKSEHRESGRKEGRDSDRKERDGRGDKSTDNEDIATDSKTGASAESEIIEKRSRRKKDNYDTGDVKDKDKHTHSGDDASKVRRKDEKHKDERHRDDRHRDKYREEGDKDSRDRYEKERNGSRSDKYVKSEKDTADDRQRKSKPRDSERDHYRDKDQDHGRDRDRDRDYDNNWDRDHDGDRDRERGRDREKDRDRDLDDYSARHKDRRGKKRSPDDRDDYSDSRPRSTKARNSETDKRPMSSTRVEADDIGRSHSHQGHSESSRRRGSPTLSAHGGADENRLAKEDTKYKDSLKESRARAISPLSGPADRGSKYPSYDRNNKMDEGLQAERSSSSKASPMGLSERSPSATSLDRRNTNRNAARRNLDTEELNRKTGTDGRDRPIEKGDEVTQADTSGFSKPAFSNTSSILAQPPRSATESSPFRGSEEDSNRGNNNVRFRRNNESGVGRGGYGNNNNNWRGVPNWSSPMPNGFMPFQHGPHGNFQAMMPHFPQPPLFAVRPPMELNQSGMPYHLPDAHLRPFGWQNMRWDGSGVLRDDTHMYQTPDWDQNRHMMNVRGWESNNTADTWKGHNNGDVNMDSRKEEQPIPAADLTNDGSNEGQCSDKGRSSEIKQEIRSDVEEITKSPSSKTSNAGNGKPDLSELSEGNDGMNLCRAYLSNLDISVELADPECYKQYVGLVEGKQTAIVNESSSVCMILAGFGRVAPQSSGASLSASVFPAENKSITQRAIDLYKKQRLEPWTIPMASGGIVDLISPPMKKKLEEEGVEKLDEPIPEKTINSETLIPCDGNEMELDSDKIPNDSTTMDVESRKEEEEEGGATGSNKVSVPLVVELGEALMMMPDSDESKMVNLSSRIQQSSLESTH